MLRTALLSALLVLAGYASTAWLTHDFQVWTAEGARRLAVAQHPVPVTAQQMAAAAREETEAHKLTRKIAREEDWLRYGVTARRKRNQRRMSELRRLREKLRVDKAAFAAKIRTIEMDPLAPTPSSKIVVEFKQVAKRFEREGKVIPILNDFSLRILKGDRIGILGRNGSGKSTFLKLLMGELEADGGFIHRSKKIDLAYFDQHRVALDRLADPEADLELRRDRAGQRERLQIGDQHP